MNQAQRTRVRRWALAGYATALLLAALAMTAAVGGPGLLAELGLPGLGSSGPPQKDMVLTAAMRREVVDNMAAALTRQYVYPDKAQAMASQLSSDLAQGRFDAITSAEKFAAALTQQLQAMTQDRHLEVRYFEQAIPLSVAGQDDDAAEEAAALEERKRFNFGFETVGRLKCDIGYLDLREFGRPAQVAGRIAAAMTLLADTRALIIDLRHTHGGDPESVMLLASYLFDQPTHLNDIYWREDDRTEVRWTASQVVGPSYGQARPIYLLTSRETFSAGEDFAYAMKYASRATLIGEATGGGAHPGQRRRLSDHFMMNIPTGRAINPVTGTDWEVVGVQPDVRVSADKALDVAQAAALERLLKSETDPVWQRKIEGRLRELR